MLKFIGWRNFRLTRYSKFFTYLRTYLLTYSKKHSHFLEAYQFSASQEIPLILWKQNVHYRIQKFPPQFPKILSQITV
jgi:hypothetical protein